MTFHWPHVLWLMLVPAALALLDLRRRKRVGQAPHPKILRATADSERLALADSGAARPRSARFRWRLWLGLSLAIVAVARPQWGRLEEKVYDQAREILIAVDLSRSMLADDVKPRRLDRAKLLITSLLERLEGERVGLVVFAGTAFLQSPLSSDYEILREFLPELNPDYLPEGGSNYTALIDTSLSAFDSSQNSDRFLIVLSDGESTADDWQQRLPALAEKGVRVISLGIGTAGGSMIPDSQGGFVKDERGAVVLSRLGTSTLQELATRTGGIYTDASNWVDLAHLINVTVEQGRRGEFTDIQQVRLAERYQWALFPALVLLLLSYWREFPVHPRARDLKLTHHQPATPSRRPTVTRAGAATTTTAALALALGLLAAAHPGRAATAAQEGQPEMVMSNTLAGPLSELVAQLSSRNELTPADYEQLGRTTLTFGQRMIGANQRVPQGPVRDALAGVDAGEELDPEYTEWDELRDLLEELLENQNQDQEQQENQENQEQMGQQDDQPSQQNPEGGQQQEQNKSDGEQNQPQGDGQQQDQQQQEEEMNNSQGDSAFGDMQQKAPPPPPLGDTQKVGGQPEQKSQQAQSPELAVPLQKLEQIKNQDSPAKLHQLMQDEKGRPMRQGRDW